VRFSTLLKQIEGSNKQTLSVALKELEEIGLLDKNVIQQKPLHIEYNLSERGKSLIPVFKQLEGLA
jgi:DNA-binding HxlR family transcriptional regulator